MSRRLRVTSAPFFKENHPCCAATMSTLWDHVVAKEIEAFLDPPHKRSVRSFRACPTALDKLRP